MALGELPSKTSSFILMEKIKNQGNPQVPKDLLQTKE